MTKYLSFHGTCQRYFFPQCAEKEVQTCTSRSVREGENFNCDLCSSILPQNYTTERPQIGPEPTRGPVCRTQLRREGRAPFPAARAGHADAAGELPVPCECRHTASNRSHKVGCLPQVVRLYTVFVHVYWHAHGAMNFYTLDTSSRVCIVERTRC